MPIHITGVALCCWSSGLVQFYLEPCLLSVRVLDTHTQEAFKTLDHEWEKSFPFWTQSLYFRYMRVMARGLHVEGITNFHLILEI